MVCQLMREDGRNVVGKEVVHLRVHAVVDAADVRIQIGDDPLVCVSSAGVVARQC